MNRMLFLALGLCAAASADPGPMTGDPKPTLGAQLTAAQADVARLTAELATAKADASKVEGLQGTISAKEALVKTLEGQLTEASAKIAKLETDAKAAEGLLTEAQAKITQLEATEKDLIKRADALAKEQLKALGIASDKLPGPQSEQPSKTDVEDKIRSLKGSDRTRAALEYKATGKLPDWVK